MHEVVNRFWEVKILFFGFGFSLAWELLQSPFYTDTFEASWDTLTYNRVHCAVGDAMILLAGFWIVAIFWGRSWIYFARWGPVISFVMTDVIYTGLSEYMNVYAFRNWSYSPWMPTVGV